jgi:hypothetical protein
MNIARPLLLTLCLVAPGCISTEEPGPMKFPKDPVCRERPAPELAPAPEAVTPIERWKHTLVRIAPAGWTVDDASSQVETPDGWTRLDGGRGLSFTVRNKDQRFVVWFMPLDWKGTFERTAPVQRLGANDQWQLFTTETGHDGWTKPEDEVARAFQVVSRG